MFAILSSSPLAAFFLGLFNYFTLSSLYVLLNISIPYEVFHYLELLYTSCSCNIIRLFDFSISLPSFTPERVNQPRALYFGVSSDLLSTNCDFLFILAFNCLIYELIVFLLQLAPKKFQKLYRTLVFYRLSLYWGLIVSNIIPLLLTWKFIIKGGSNKFASTANLAAHYLLICFFTFLLIASLFHELKTVKCRAKQ